MRASRMNTEVYSTDCIRYGSILTSVPMMIVIKLVPHRTRENEFYYVLQSLFLDSKAFALLVGDLGDG